MAAASHAATAARSSFHWPNPHFDSATALAWAAPTILLAPLFGFAWIAFGVRTRKWTSTFAITAAILALVGSVVVAWVQFPRGGVFDDSDTQWISITPSFTGPPQFQSFVVQFSVAFDRAGMVALIGILLLFTAALVWARVGARDEPGPARTAALIVLFMFGSVGVLLSADLLAVLAFWGLAGIATYLLFQQRWGWEPAARASRLTLPLPLAADLALLTGIAILYSRYGVTIPSQLAPVLHQTPGWGYKSLTIAGILIGVGIGGRAALVPFHAWQEAPAATVPLALAQGVWPVLAGVVFYRCLPLIRGAGPQATVTLLVWFLVAAGLAAVLALSRSGLRRALSGAGLAATALGLVAILDGHAGAGLTGLVAIGVARG
ncbi:MAG TPA: proton-conducting transporter membrane subunit, partial [Candidatus Dormibacteraeota bacterium]|nr:proton-conducting transporter membrane subunit [Candidatus Dormibacteraeota bacterium]